MKILETIKEIQRQRSLERLKEIEREIELEARQNRCPHDWERIGVFKKTSAMAGTGTLIVVVDLCRKCKKESKEYIQI